MAHHEMVMVLTFTTHKITKSFWARQEILTALLHLFITFVFIFDTAFFLSLTFSAHNLKLDQGEDKDVENKMCYTVFDKQDYWTKVQLNVSNSGSFYFSFVKPYCSLTTCLTVCQSEL